jgi:hypothetical protein
VDLRPQLNAQGIHHGQQRFDGRIPVFAQRRIESLPLKSDFDLMAAGAESSFEASQLSLEDP